VIHVTTAVVTAREAAWERFQLPSDSWPAVATVDASGGSTGENLATGVREVLDGRNCQTSGTSYVRGHSPTRGRRTFLCLVRPRSPTLEQL
jgi:hypothetical protein